MRKILCAIYIAAACAMPSSASAAVVKWTVRDLVFDQSGFQSLYFNGSFEYDQAINVFSNASLTLKSQTLCCWDVSINTNTSTASVLDLASTANHTFHLDLASAMTGAGGTIALTSGTSSSGWTLRAGQSISAPTPRPTETPTPTPVVSPVPEPASWMLMMAGFTVLGAAMRRRKPVIAGLA